MLIKSINRASSFARKPACCHVKLCNFCSTWGAVTCKTLPNCVPPPHLGHSMACSSKFTLTRPLTLSWSGYNYPYRNWFHFVHMMYQIFQHFQKVYLKLLAYIAIYNVTKLSWHIISSIEITFRISMCFWGGKREGITVIQTIYLFIYTNTTLTEIWEQIN